MKMVLSPFGNVAITSLSVEVRKSVYSRLGDRMLPLGQVKANKR